MNGQQRVIIENVKPKVNNGKYPVKRVVNQDVTVSADIYCDSHDVLTAELLYKHQEDKEWNRIEMIHEVNDLWKGTFLVKKTGQYEYTIRAWVDHFKSWHRDILKKIEAETDYKIDLLAGAELIDKALKNNASASPVKTEYLQSVMADFSSTDKPLSEKISALETGDLLDIMKKFPVRQHITEYPKSLLIQVDRKKADFSTWYEAFPRSLGKDETVHGTFADTIDFLPYVAEMGFDVLYLPPIHPIGETNRKGKNNRVTAEKGEPGSPWAIGGSEGGHKSIHSQLGTFADFEKLIAAAAEKDIEIAMDVAFQCSPDHPWVKDHPEWFKKRPDGTLQYAENPPKKYEDIYPLNFETKEWESLWEELKSVFLFWIEKGVKIFRVDNPHTKSMRFWGWAISEIKKDHPDIIFLAEAFTRPKVMYQLAKRGFTQSYTYFTWRNTKYEITTYCEELVNTDAVEIFRPNFWPNTPDILPEFLQVTERTGYIQRLLLAATLSSNYGIYGPAFELQESAPVAPGKEEYLNSEKYEIKNWNTGDSKNLNKIIARINKIRKENEALQNTHSLKFHHINNESLICYSKTSANKENIILVIINLDPHHTQSGWMYFPLDQFDMDSETPFQVHDLLSDSFYLWNGEHNFVEINPGIMPAHIFRIRRKVRSERDFDYFM